jgi:rhodanese-related sulfurtransferase
MNKLKVIIILAGLLCSGLHAYETISADTLAAWMETGTSFDFILIDVRDLDEVDSVIASDTCRPYHFSWREDVLSDSMELIPQDIPVVVYCRSGGRSASASAFLEEEGYTVYNLQGGITAWKSSIGILGLRADIRPYSDLPTPSMQANPAYVYVQEPGRPAENPVITVLSRGPYISISINNNALVKGSHYLSVLTPAGGRVYRVHNPFAETSLLRLPFNAAGWYVLSFQSRELTMIWRILS